VSGFFGGTRPSRHPVRCQDISPLELPRNLLTSILDIRASVVGRMPLRKCLAMRSMECMPNLQGNGGRLASSICSATLFGADSGTERGKQFPGVHLRRTSWSLSCLN
jgi:hypothetical protein